MTTCVGIEWNRPKNGSQNNKEVDGTIYIMLGIDVGAGQYEHIHIPDNHLVVYNNEICNYMTKDLAEELATDVAEEMNI